MDSTQTTGAAKRVNANRSRPVPAIRTAIHPISSTRATNATRRTIMNPPSNISGDVAYSARIKPKCFVNLGVRFHDNRSLSKAAPVAIIRVWVRAALANIDPSMILKDLHPASQ